MSNLVIVESPSKSKTIEKYLGANYQVVSSKGHIRDLATTGKYGLGIELENNFKPNYIPIKGKGKVITDLKKLAKTKAKVILATDPDREGEAISWHLFDALGLKENNYERVVFNELTKGVIVEAFQKPRKIDYDLVKSQETRRILDRIIGFRLSKLMQSKTGGKSAGRVQSVALKLIVDREREIENFKEEEYWTITAQFADFNALLEKYHGKKVEVKNEQEAIAIIAALSNAFNIEGIEAKEKNKGGKIPFKTSTMQQAAANTINFSSTKTMKTAQKLYEGIDVGKETVGLITYMRTDSVRLSPQFINETFTYIKGKYGAEYVGSVKVDKSKSKTNVQDAHEGIRPTSINRTPESIKEFLSSDEYKLYALIYYRTLASLMADARVLATTISLENNGYLFKATGSVLKFDGYLKVYAKYEDFEDTPLPDLTKYQSKVIVANEVLKEQHFTKPVARYNESSLIKELEKLGIGRPSTYATIIETIKARDYVKLEDKKFFPTTIGIETTDKLQEFFSDIVNVEYTASMEKDLDEIAEAKKNNIELLTNFYDKFEPLVQNAFKNMEKKEAVLAGEKCPECNNELVIRKGRYGEFIACSNYPQCKYVKKTKTQLTTIMACPKCQGQIIEKKTKKGKIFYGCNNYPKCDFASWYKPIVDTKCPDCGGILVEKKDKIACLSCTYEK